MQSGGEGTVTWGTFPGKSEDTVARRRLLCKGGEGVCATIRGSFTPSLFSIRRRHIFSFLGRFGRHVACHNELRQVKSPPLSF